MNSYCAQLRGPFSTWGFPHSARNDTEQCTAAAVLLTGCPPKLCPPPAHPRARVRRASRQTSPWCAQAGFRRPAASPDACRLRRAPRRAPTPPRRNEPDPFALCGTPKKNWLPLCPPPATPVQSQESGEPGFARGVREGNERASRMASCKQLPFSPPSPAPGESVIADSPVTRDAVDAAPR